MNEEIKIKVPKLITDPNCKRCYGRGYIGINQNNNTLILCKCATILSNDYEEFKNEVIKMKDKINDMNDHINYLIDRSNFIFTTVDFILSYITDINMFLRDESLLRFFQKKKKNSIPIIDEIKS